jgi:hypothetical protein
MSVNDRIEVLSGDIAAGQLAPSQANRTEFTPGKATSLPLDQNWPTDHRIPTGTTAFDGEAAGPVEMERSRVVKLGRNIVCDQVLPVPTITGTRVESVCETGVNGTNTTQDTVNPPNPAILEKTTGYDNIKGA